MRYNSYDYLFTRDNSDLPRVKRGCPRIPRDEYAIDIFNECVKQWGMTSPADDADVLPPRIALGAAGIGVPTYQTLYRRGQLGDAFFGPSTARGTRQFTREGVLALAAFRAAQERGLDIGELPPDAFFRWVSLWDRTRGTAKPVRQLVVRYYGQRGAPDSKTSILPNDDVLPEPPAPGARLTIIFDLDEIFGAAERAIAVLSADPVEVYAPEDGDS